MRAPLLPLFLVSLVALGFEISLARYFAVASWAEYGYWVISIAMVGISASGVVLSLFKDAFIRRKDSLLLWTPGALMLCAASGYYLATVNPFNPLELQNAALWQDQLWNIGKYYLALFPFFFLAGVYTGLYFIAFQDRIPQAYGADLAGAGAGGIVVLALMVWVHPFDLPAALMPLLVAAGLLHLRSIDRIHAGRAVAIIVAALAISEAVLLGLARPDFNQYKSIYVPLHVPGSRVVEERRSARGLFQILDDFTERLEMDFSNNARLIGAPEPPTTLGLYQDGNRLTSLPKTAAVDARYVRAALEAFPYLVRPGSRVMLIGTRGGFRIAEARHLGASTVLAIEPDPMISYLVTRWLDGAQGVAPAREHPAVVAGALRGAFHVVDVSADFLTQGDANRYVFTVEGVQALIGALDDEGILSLPVSIQELPVYAIKVLRTARLALAGMGVTRPERHLAVYRSAWNARILVFRSPPDAAFFRTLREFADERSFDVSYYPGIDPRRVKIWNDLPLVSFEDETILSASDGPSDALMIEALAVLAGAKIVSNPFFNTAPSTYDRPAFYSVLHWTQWPTILSKIELVPREEMASLINGAVLLQALLFAAVVLGLPLLRWRARLLPTGAIVKAVLYFGALGLGFLFLEILLIEKAAFLFNDRTLAFALVLTGMLLFSGLGSARAARHMANPRRGVVPAALAVCAWSVLAFLALDLVLQRAIAWPIVFRAALVTGLVAPLGLALGSPFPLGLTLFRGTRAGFLPWAWSINGAFSVISTPLANLLVVTVGYRIILIASCVLYASLLITFPEGEKNPT